MASVSFENVVKQFGDVKAVNDLNIQVADKEFLVLVGPSGCGKTTALRSLAGLEEITSGNIKIGDRIVNDVAPKDRDIAMVFQSYALYPHLSVYDNMAFGLTPSTAQGEISAVSVTLPIFLDPGLLSATASTFGGHVSVGRWAVRSCANRNSSCSMSRSPTGLQTCCVAMRVRSALHQRLQTTFIYVSTTDRSHDDGNRTRSSTKASCSNGYATKPVDTHQSFVAGSSAHLPEFLPRQTAQGGGKLVVDTVIS